MSEYAAKLRAMEQTVEIERLTAPATFICWTPDHIPVEKREVVVLVREKSLKQLEQFAAHAAVEAENRQDTLNMVRQALVRQAVA
jgi:hypothetical protein